MPRTSQRLAAVLTVATLVIAACGDDSSSSSSSTTDTSTPSAPSGPSASGGSTPSQSAPDGGNPTGGTSESATPTTPEGSYGGSASASGGITDSIGSAPVDGDVGTPLDMQDRPIREPGDLGLSLDPAALAGTFGLDWFVYPDTTGARIVSFQVSTRVGLSSMEQSANVGVAFDSKLGARRIATLVRKEIEPPNKYRIDERPSQGGDVVNLSAVPKNPQASIPHWLVAVMSTESLAGGKRFPGNRFANVGMIGQPIDRGSVPPPAFVDAKLAPITRITSALQYEFYGWSYNLQTTQTGRTTEAYTYRFVTTDKELKKTADDIAAKVGPVQNRKNKKKEITFTAGGIDWTITPQGNTATITMPV